jgi:hypothetical protein
MTLAAQENTWLSVAVASHAGYSVRRPRFFPCLAALCLLLVPISSKADAPQEEAESCLLQYTSIPLATATTSLWFISYPSVMDPKSDLLQLRDETDLSFLLGPPRTSSRFSYLSWARLHTGFGQFYESDTLRVSRTNGAGFDKPHWLFLKFSFRL